MTAELTIKRPQGGGMQPVLTEEQILWALDQRRRGVSTPKLAVQLHVHESTVARWTKRYGYDGPRHIPIRRLSSEELLETVGLAGEGYSATDIATLLGVHPTTVRWRLRKHARDQNWRRRRHRLAEHDSPKGV